MKSRISNHSIYELTISLAAIIGATILTSQIEYGQISLKGVFDAQKASPILWIMDSMPFFFALLGYFERPKTHSKMETLLIDPTEGKKSKTRDLINKAMRSVIHDPLTGLPNRVLFRDHLEYAIKIASRERTRLSVFMLDLDSFKEINNTLGHFSGDLLLRAVALRLLKVLRKSDTLARFEGDAFAILLPAVNEMNDLDVISNKLRKAFDPPFIIEGIHLDVNASTGAVLFPDHSQDADTLLKKADVAMYFAKNKNKQFFIYNPEVDTYNSYRLTLMGELKNAINNDELTLYYQPKVDIEHNRVIGAEALIRWTHPDHGIILPDEFISVAERTGLINPLFQWVANQAAQQTAVWRKSGLDLSVSINLSPKNILDPKLRDIIARLPATYEIPPQKIIFELTETAIMSDPDLALEIVSHISEMGFKLSIDDFGTGYSSFAYLAKLPVNEIKIDKSFVMDMIKNETNYIIVYTAIEMAHNLGLKVVAEGVEDEEILRELKLMGCDMAQGHLINRPVSSSEFESWINSSKWGKGF